MDVTSWDVALLRLGLAALGGAIIGLERESHGRAAGLRTTMLVCIAAAAAMLISERLLVEHTVPGSMWRPDPARLAAGVLTGMGFLGAGAILREGNMVRGITTAAALWFVTILGLAFGSGEILIGLIGLAMAIIILMVLSRIEHAIPRDWYGAVTLVLAMDGPTDQDIRTRIESKGVAIKKMELAYDLEQRRRTVCFALKYKKRGTIHNLARSVIDDLVACPGVLHVKWV